MTCGSALFSRSIRYLRMRSSAATLRVWMPSNCPWLSFVARPEAAIASSNAASVQFEGVADDAAAGAALAAADCAAASAAALSDEAGPPLGPHEASPAAARLTPIMFRRDIGVGKLCMLGSS